MKITSKGQITIPLRYRREFGFLPNTHIEFVRDGAELKLVKPRRASDKGKKVVEKMRGAGNGKWTTEQIMKLMRG